MLLLSLGKFMMIFMILSENLSQKLFSFPGLKSIYFFNFRTMIDNECNILQNMSKSEYKQFRSLMIEMVLHTGMIITFNTLLLNFSHTPYLQTCQCTSLK